MFTKLRSLLLVVKNREFGDLFQALRRRLWSTEASFCLSRDLTVPFDPPEARVPFTIRKLESTDRDEILRERPRRLPLLQMNPPTCYLAQAESGEICYMQWLFGPSSNKAIEEIFEGRVEPLEPDQALLEFAYTFQDWRGKRLMPRAMALIAEKARDLGCRHVITFVRVENIPALKGCQRAGFFMHGRQVVRWRLFFQVSVETTEFASSTPFPWEHPEA